MTLTEALRAHYKQGRIASPWLPGMLAIWGYDDTDDNRPMHWRCERNADDNVTSGPSGDGRWQWNLNSEPDTTDPATVGCLWALVDEVSPGSGGRGFWSFDDIRDGQVPARMLIALAGGS